MPHRRELRGIAQGIVGSFVSRNNDVGGYWALGKLCSHAANSSMHEVTIDLVATTMTPSCNEYDAMVAHYSTMLWELVAHRGLSRCNVVRADVHARFVLPESQVPRSSGDDRGHPYECVLEISDDLGRVHVGRACGWVEPHEPRLELRSSMHGPRPRRMKRRQEGR